MQPQGDRPPRHLGSSRITPGNRKLCEVCGKDVTFAADRIRTPAGAFQCKSCSTKTNEASDSGGSELFSCDNCGAVAFIATATGQGSRRLCDNCAVVNREVIKAPTSALIHNHSNVGRKNALNTMWITLGAAVGLVSLGIAAAWLIRPSWESQNEAKLLAIKSDADALLGAKKPKEAYYKYQLLDAETNGRSIDSKSFLAGELAAAAESKQIAYKQAAPIIEREKAEERERIAAIKKAAEEQQAQARAAAEAQRLENERQAAARAEAERLEKAAAAERARRAIMHATARKSPAYLELKARANRVVSSFRRDKIGEDSAYRSMSRAAGAQRDLLAIYITIEGMLCESDVADQVRKVISDSDAELIGEDSALRSVYKKDSASFELLGIWTDILEKRFPGLHKAFVDQKRTITTKMIAEDSAPRAIEYFTEGNMIVLGQIVSRLAPKAEVNKLSTNVLSENIAENSAWRASMREAEASTAIFLLLLETTDRTTADRLRKSLNIGTITEDSALRAHARYKETAVEALQRIIQLD